ncbi:MAG: ATP-binding cassette domain-containing protein [Sphingobacteriaceae bacterium]|nr:ATP-binding cassette domain-containing protein [Sphingobacteriaceae bacterium]
MSDILEADSITKAFGRRPILTDIFLKCETGDILGLMGRNGTGKSTLLKILFGTLKADNKFLRINGEVCPKPFTKNDLICYLPQDSFLPGNLQVERAIELYLGREAVLLFLQDEYLCNVNGSQVSSLSGGELRYLEIKLLLNLKSKFILLDEPFNGISPLVVEGIKAMILAASATKGIILSDHDFRNVLDVSNRCCLLLDGGIKTISYPEELVKWGYVSASKFQN